MFNAGVMREKLPRDRHVLRDVPRDHEPARRVDETMGSLDVTLGQCVDATYVDAQHAHAADVQGDPFPRANEAFDLFLLTEVDVVVLVATTNVFEVRYHR